MNYSLDKAIKAASDKNYCEEVDALSKKQLTEYIDIADDQIPILVDKMLALPTDLLELLFFKYCFNLAPTDAQNVFGTTKAVGELRYTHKLLSLLMDIENMYISNKSIGDACDIALQKYLRVEQNKITSLPSYSKEFRARLSQIPAAQSRVVGSSSIKRAMELVFASVIAFSAVAITNAEFRESINKWIVETFPQFSVFIPIQEKAVQIEEIDLSEISFNYIPESFELTQSAGNNELYVYEFKGNNENFISISVARTSRFFNNTENSAVNEFSFMGNTAYSWEVGNFVHMVCKKDNIHFSIIANVSLEEIVRIAENIDF